jgi:hypothetical protein
MCALRFSHTSRGGRTKIKEENELLSKKKEENKKKREGKEE